VWLHCIKLRSFNNNSRQEVLLLAEISCERMEMGSKMKTFLVCFESLSSSFLKTQFYLFKGIPGCLNSNPEPAKSGQLP
jgi:hypothetical protein